MTVLLEPFGYGYMFNAMWVNGRNMAEVSEIIAVMNEAGLDARAAGEAVQQPEIKQQLIDAGQEAVDRGVFGAPTMFVNGVMHWGQDRIDWVEEALAA